MSDRPNNPLEAEVEDPLGAAATLPGRRSRDGRDGRGATGSTKDRRRLPGRGLGLLVLLIVGLAMVPVVFSTFEKTPPDKFGLSYGGGPIEGVQYQRTVAPGSGRFFNGIFDHFYLYPADQQSYVTAGAGDTEEGSETTGAITAPTSDRVAVGYQVAVYFKLNSDLLRSFHEEVGLSYSASTPSGWDEMMAGVVRPQIESALQEQTRRHAVSDLFGDAEILRTLQTEVGAALGTRLEAALGERYFCSPGFEPGAECQDPTFIITRIDLPSSVLDAFERNRTAAIDVESREAEAEAIAAITEILGPDAYPLLRAIESGAVSFWVLPDGGVTIAAPDAPTDPAAGGGEEGPADGGGG